MKIHNIREVEEFTKAVDSCKGDVYLISQYGDKYNLKSKLSQYVGVAALIGEHGEELELFCDCKSDEVNFLSLFKNEPDILKG